MRNKLLFTIFVSTFFALYFLFNIVILPHYGISWDEPFHYLRGQIYLQYFLTGNGDTFDATSKLSSYQNFNVLIDGNIVNFSFLSKNDAGHPPLNGILAAISNRVFYQNLGLLGDIESYHLFIILVSVFLVFLVFFWTYKTYGMFAGIIAFLSIALYPLFFAESHFNIKDPVEAFFYVTTLLTFYHGIVKNNWRWIVVSSIFAGFALGTKFNIVFAVFTILPWLIIYKWKEIKSFIYPFSKKLTIALFFFPLITLGILYAAWPFLWQSPINNLLKIITYYKEIGSTITYQPAEYLIFGKINIFAIQWIFYTTPIVILVFFTFGVIYSLTKGFKEKNKTSLFILFWFLVPVIRVILPNAGIYGGVRQIMEYIPAMAILSGIGAKYFAKQVSSIMYQVLRIKSGSKKSFIRYTLYFILIFSFLPITLKLVSIHPNESVYFNPLIGGLKGAKEKNIMYWGYNLGNVFRQAAVWLNQNAEKNSRVTRGTAYEDIIAAAWFRKDINYSHDYQSGFRKKGEYIIEFTHDMPVWPRYYYYNYARNMLKPLYEIKIDGVPILTVWKNDRNHTKDEFKREEETINITNVKKGKNYILIDLQREILLTELNIIFSNPNCHFTEDGYFVTADSSGKWTNHPGNLGEIAFYTNFDPREKKDALSYLFPAEKTRLVKVIYSESNNCFGDLKSVNIKRVPL